MYGLKEKPFGQYSDGLLETFLISDFGDYWNLSFPTYAHNREVCLLPRAAHN